MAHPLSGANLQTLISAFRRGGRPDRIATSMGIWAAALGRSPASLAEKLWLARRLPDLEDLPPPVFILGHWRSGTTHLYNVMSLGNFSYVPPVAVGLPWDMQGIGQVLRPVLERALPEHRWIDKIPVTPTSPQEDEIGLASMTDLSFYHGIYFPNAFDRLIDRGLFFDDCTPDDIAQWEDRFTYFLRKIAYAQGKPLLIKNPVYTGRVAQIRQIFPAAKFIHIHRNPLDVFRSMQNFYAKLLEVMALQNIPPGLDVDETILRVYDRMMANYVHDTQDLAPPDLVELPYDALDRDPVAALEHIYDGLRLDGFATARPAFESYLASIRNFEKNRFETDPQVVSRLAERWGRWFRHWGYDIEGAPT